MLYSFEGNIPRLEGNNIFIAEEACIIGAVIIQNNVCILPYAVIRADNAPIHIGEGTNIQDGVIIHTDPGIPIKIGNNSTIAHKAILHGCDIGNNSIIAIGATILNGAKIGNNCLVAANTLILENQTIPDNSFVVGTPGVVKKQFTNEEIQEMSWYAQHYIEKIHRFNQNLVKISE